MKTIAHIKKFKNRKMQELVIRLVGLRARPKRSQWYFFDMCLNDFKNYKL